ncbi:MAG: FAD-dependent oxidoreductase [Desulfobulbaceae bacterium]|nr:FAD-dependent oxidoreductase [Desulfobulbaceae bacterium]
MSEYSLIIIGGGLSGLAAGIRFARFGGSVLILEKHVIPGGLNSYYFRKGFLFETGLHAMTNFADPTDKHAPLNRLFRQIKLSRKKFETHEQRSSLIHFPDHSLCFSNDFNLLREEIASSFPSEIDGFDKLQQVINDFDAFSPGPWISTRKKIAEYLRDPLLIDMLLLPLMVYGNSDEHDMDFGQFVIMFRSIFKEGFFRPHGTMKEFLDLLVDKFKSFGGEIRYKSQVVSVEKKDQVITGVTLSTGETIGCENIISTIGAPGTWDLVALPHEKDKFSGKMSFVESIYLLPHHERGKILSDHTIIFYSEKNSLHYCRPKEPVDPDWGVICFPENFQGLPPGEHFQVRVTNSANYELWKNASPAEYKLMKQDWGEKSKDITSKIIGNYRQNIVYEDSFTPVTIEKFTGKAEGAVYGSSFKIKDGKTPFKNLFIAGTDQGFLGIVGSMLSGVSMVNQHVLMGQKLEKEKR